MNSVPLLHELAEFADAEGLGGVVTRRDEGDAALAAVRHRALGGLAGEEGVEAEVGGLERVVGARARDDAQRADLIRPGWEGDRRAAPHLPHAPAERLAGPPLPQTRLPPRGPAPHPGPTSPPL